MKKGKVQRLHFSITGEWLTWMLRHLWVEGSEQKAVRVWQASFPKLSKIEHLSSYFIKVVSGRSKFVGVNSYTLEKDETKYWNPQQDGEPSKAFPLLQSWEDVILLKKVKLYLAEVNLREFRLQRRYGNTHEDVHHHAMQWITAAEENVVENNLRREVNVFYTDIRNFRMLIGLDMSLEMLPEKTRKWDTRTYRNRKGLGDPAINYGLDLYYEIYGTLAPWRTYFMTKYGTDMLNIDDCEIKDMCGCSDEKIERYQQTKVQEEHQEEYNERVAKITNNIIPGMDVESYINGALAESRRDDISAENVNDMVWRSGYIDKHGAFYGCGDINHLNFAYDMCKLLKVKGYDKDSFDAQVYLDNLGWVKVSVNRFYWDKEPNEFQKKSMLKYMEAKKLDKTVFNITGKAQTFYEAFTAK